MIERIWSHVGTIEVLGLQGSDVGSSGKSEVMLHVSCEVSHQSRSGVTERFILHSVESGSQTYSIREVSSLERRYVGDCQTKVDVTRSGSIDVSIGEFLRVITRVVTTAESIFERIWIVRVWSQTGTID